MITRFPESTRNLYSSILACASALVLPLNSLGGNPFLLYRAKVTNNNIKG